MPSDRSDASNQPAAAAPESADARQAPRPAPAAVPLLAGHNRPLPGQPGFDKSVFDRPLPSASAAYKPPPEPVNPRQLAFYAGGFVLAAAAVAATVMALVDKPDRTPLSRATEVIAAQPPGRALAYACPLQPATAVTGGKDGRFPLHTDVSGLTATDAASFIVLGKEAAAAGRPRDAESAFLMACRVSAQVSKPESVEFADARYQLAWHYSRLALDGKPASGFNRAELLQRAEQLYASSQKAYLAKYGPNHEKSRFAAEGLAALRQTSAQPKAGSVHRESVAAVPAPAQPAPLARQAAVVAPAPTAAPGPIATAPAPAARPAPAGAPQPAVVAQADIAQARPAAPVMATAPGSATAASGRDSRSAALAVPGSAGTPLPREAYATGPSFDCNKARSTSEKIICSDAGLSQLDRELGRVYARAKAAAPDPAAFRRQQEQEWRRREATCRDRECLERWYAQRRVQLTSVAAQPRRIRQPEPVATYYRWPEEARRN